MKLRVLTIMIVLSGLLLGVTLYAAGDTLEELEEKRDALVADMAANQEGQESTAEQIELANRILFDIGQNILALEEDLLTLDLEMEVLRVDKSDKETEIIAIEEKLKLAKEEEALYQEQVAERIQVMYEYGDVEFLQILFESENLSDLFTRIEYINRVFNYDEKMFDELEEMQREISASEANVEVANFELDAIIESTEAKRNKVEEIALEKGLLKDLVESTQIFLEIQQEQLKADELELESNISETLDAIDALQYTWDDGILSWPSPGYNWITSPFGWRTHPIRGTKSFHNAIDIGVPYGGEIVAAEKGIVVSSYYSSSYGNVITIYHGMREGYKWYTLYAHNSKLLVSKEDEVERGELIALAGSTGWSTGPHLHFGVKRDKEWVDPMDFFVQ